MQKFPMTAEGLARLEEELKVLKGEERPAIIRAIAEARAHGDLSENAEYHAARERQSFIEGRIAELEGVIPSVEVIDVSRLSGDKVLFGARVTIVDEESEDEKTYRIVGQYEADMKNGSISVTSPLAKALMGKKVGDAVEVPAPGGARSVEITAVTLRLTRRRTAATARARRDPVTPFVFHRGPPCAPSPRCAPPRPPSRPPSRWPTSAPRPSASAAPIIRTPTIENPAVSRAAGTRVLLKLDNLQATGAFKERGAANRLALLTAREKAAGVIAMSAGNHAQAVARHAQLAGVAATIVMPRFTPATKVVRTESWGARVVLHGETLAEAAAHAHDLALREGLVFVHPYDDPAVIAGQGTMALEMLEDAPEIEALVIPIGGGGLCAGIASAVGRTAPGHAGVRRRGRGLPRHGAAPGGPARSASAARPSPRASPCATWARCRWRSCGAWASRCCWCPNARSNRRSRCWPKARRWWRKARARRASPPCSTYPERFAGRVVGTTVCGGNIDPRMLANVLLRNLLRDGRILRAAPRHPRPPRRAGRHRDAHGGRGRQRDRGEPPAPVRRALRAERRAATDDRGPRRAQGDAIIAALEAGDTSCGGADRARNPGACRGYPPDRGRIRTRGCDPGRPQARRAGRRRLLPRPSRRGGRGRPCRRARLFRHALPARPRVEAGDRRRLARRIGPEILFPDRPVVADHEGLDAGDAVARRRGDHRPAADHPPVHHEVHRAALRRRALRFQDAEDVAVEGLRRAPARARVAARAGGRGERAERARRLALGGRPVQPVALPGGGEEAPGIGAEARPGARRCAAKSSCASAIARSVSMVSSSLRPIRRLAISWPPATASKRQTPPRWSIGIGSGQPSAPICSTARSGAGRRISFLASYSARKRSRALRSATGSPERMKP